MALCYVYKKLLSGSPKSSTDFITGLNNCNQFIKIPQPYPNRFKLVKGQAVPIPTYEPKQGTQDIDDFRWETRALKVNNF